MCFRKYWVFIAVLMLGWSASARAISGQHIVSDVFDGDSFAIPASTPSIRILAINTNEFTDACAGIHALLAKNRLIELVEGQTVTLSGDTSVTYPSHSGGSPRPGRFVDIGQTDVGDTLLREGLALPYAHADETSRNDKYLDSAVIAQKNGLGIWNSIACGSGPDQDISIDVKVRWDAAGNDSQNVNGEWIDIINNGNRNLSLEGWRLRDPATRFYEFPSGSSIPAGQIMRVHIGQGSDNALEKYWGLDAPIFENDVDQGVYLLDPDNDIRATFAYSCRIDCVDTLKGKMVIDVNYDAVGDDNNNPNGEWVDVMNLTGSTIELYGYYLRNSNASYYQFEPEHHVNPSSLLRIKVGQGNDTETILYAGRSSPLFTNSGGQVSLLRIDNVVIDQYIWPDKDPTPPPSGGTGSQFSEFIGPMLSILLAN